MGWQPWAASWAARLVAAFRVVAVVALVCRGAWAADEVYPLLNGYPDQPPVAEPRDEYFDPGIRFLNEPPGCEFWTIDFRCRTLFSSNTSYEFGTPPEVTPGWAPLSRLNFALNSTWFGFQIAKETPKWAFQFEWLMAGECIDGGLADYDWNPPNADGSFTDLGFARERFTEGQMLDINLKYQLLDIPCRCPLQVWPMVGFRWQRFDVTAYDLQQVKSDNVWLDPPFTYEGDVITFNQDFSIGYLGVQVRGGLPASILPPLVWTLQGDWGYTEAYGVDHHLIREGDMYGINCTHGTCWHAALTVEALATARISIGVQADYLQIDTTGTHRWLNEPIGADETWGNGVSASSQQESITAFLRIRM